MEQGGGLVGRCSGRGCLTVPSGVIQGRASLCVKWALAWLLEDPWGTVPTALMGMIQLFVCEVMWSLVLKVSLSLLFLPGGIDDIQEGRSVWHLQVGSVGSVRPQEGKGHTQGYQ